MLSRNKYLFAAMLAIVSTGSFAGSTTWNFETDKPGYNVQSSGSHVGNKLTIDSDSDGTAELEISAWADTGCGWNCGDDDEVYSAYASTNSWGLLNYNRDSQNNYLTGEDHTIDSFDDYDMMLFDFKDSVSLTGINLGWAGDSDISVAAFSSMPTLTGNTWSQVVDQAVYSSSFLDIGTGFSSLANQVGGAVVEAQYWLIGAYNTVFGNICGGCGGNDSFKIASITTHKQDKPDPKPPTEVAEPSTIAMFASFGLFMMWRRRQSA